MTETSTIAIAEHKLGEWNILKESSANSNSNITEPGLAERKCEFCDYSQQTSFTEKKDLLQNNNENVLTENSNFETKESENLKNENNKTTKSFTEKLPYLIIGIIVLILIACVAAIPVIFVVIILLKRKH